LLRIVVGYGGSSQAGRALDAAVRLLQGRIGCIDVVCVAHLSPGQLRGRGADWQFERRQGSSSHATHRMVGSVAVSRARHAPVPLVIVL
jgi:nucleotide-binding universal stress UspA family protein